MFTGSKKTNLVPHRLGFVKDDGKPGHRADKCRTGQKSSKLNQMDLDEPELDSDTINLKG